MNKSKKNLLFLISIVAFILLISLGVVLSDSHSDTTHATTTDNNDSNNVEPIPDENDVKEKENQDEPEEEKLASVTGLVIGFDKSLSLTDVIMVGYLDTTSNKIKLISIPRDIMIDFRDDKFKHIKERNDNINVKFCKLTDLYWLAGKTDVVLNDIKEIISIITGLDITYMATINTDGFREVVDIVGGVEFYVPRRMYYPDPSQGLYIDLEEGLQVLDGDKAEQLVRFRKSLDGNSYTDIQRMETQQKFLIALSEKLLGIKDPVKIMEIVNSSYDYIQTDFGLIMALDYAEYLYNMNLESILDPENMVIVPTYGEKIEGLWYEVWNEDEVNELITNLINK